MFRDLATRIWSYKMKADPIMRAYIAATNCYLAGAGLPPIKMPQVERCAECDRVLEDGENELCQGCNDRLVREQAEDHRLDDNRRGQAEWINKQF